MQAPNAHSHSYTSVRPGLAMNVSQSENHTHPLHLTVLKQPLLCTVIMRHYTLWAIMAYWLIRQVGLIYDLIWALFLFPHYCTVWMAICNPIYSHSNKNRTSRKNDVRTYIYKFLIIWSSSETYWIMLHRYRPQIKYYLYFIFAIFLLYATRLYHTQLIHKCMRMWCKTYVEVHMFSLYFLFQKKKIVWKVVSTFS